MRQHDRLLGIISKLLIFTLLLSLSLPIVPVAQTNDTKATEGFETELKAIIEQHEAIIEQEPTLHPMLSNLSGSNEISVIVQMSEPPVALEKGKKDSQGKTFSTFEKRKVQHKVKTQQEQFQTELNKKGINHRKNYSYSEAFNGISIKLNANEVKELIKLEGVVSVEPDLEVRALGQASQIQTEHTPMLPSSISYLNIPALWEMGFEGQGVKIAVLDTGIDYNHPDFAGVYKGGHNFVTHDSNYARPRASNDPYETSPLDRPSSKPELDSSGNTFQTSHGTHVAGIIAAQGNNIYGIKGLAPKIELYAYRVLGAYGIGTTSAIIAAIDKAVQEDMDIINLSFGGNVNSQTTADAIAINNAVLAGVTAVVAAGNSGPTEGSIGTPATSPLAISVANSTLPEVSIKADAVLETESYKVKSTSRIIGWTYGYNPQEVLSGTFEMQAVEGTGVMEDYSTLDVNGKVVLLSTGNIPIEEKIKNAKNAGAIAVLIYPSLNDPNGLKMIGDSFDYVPTIPLSTSVGTALKSALSTEQGTVSFSNFIKESIGGNEIHETSSRGPANPNFDIKPDISAPGTNIMSTIASYGKDFSDVEYSKSYERFSGTSMATPHVTAIAALLISKNPNWTPTDIKVAISNTAKQLDTTRFSVFAQGAGLVQPHKAVLAQALVYSLDKTSFDSKVVEYSKGTITFGQVVPDELNSTMISKQIKIQSLNVDDHNYDASIQVTKTPTGDMALANVTMDKMSFTLTNELVINVNLHVPNGTSTNNNELLGYIHITNGTTNLSLPFAADLSNGTPTGLKEFAIDDYTLSPNGDGLLDQTTLNYDFYNNHDYTLIELWDASNPNGGKYKDGYLGYLLNTSKVTAGPKSLIFDGSYIDWADKSKKVAPEGVFSIDITSVNPMIPGQYTFDYVGPIYIKTSIPKISFITADQLESEYHITGRITDKFIDFKPIVENSFILEYDVNDHLETTYEVVDQEANVVTSGNVHLEQDGTFTFIQQDLESGEYTLKLSVVDRAHNQNEEVLSFIVKNGNQEIPAETTVEETVNPNPPVSPVPTEPVNPVLIEPEQPPTESEENTDKETEQVELITFPDIKNHWAKEQIEVLASHKIILGKAPSYFAPEGKVTRAEFAVLLSRALQLPLVEYEGIFTDVSENKAWAYAGIEAARRAGIVLGKADGSFNPDANITREEIAVMIVRAIKTVNHSALENLNTSNIFTDHDKISSFALDSVQKTNALGIVQGRSGNKYDPQADVTRAETAVMLYRALDEFGITLNK